MATTGIIVISILGGSSAGDTMLAVVFSDQAISIPSGWILALTGLAAGIQYRAYTHVLTAGDISGNTSWTFVMSQATGGASYFVFDIINLAGLGNTQITAITTASTNFTAPSIPATTGDMCLAFYGATGGGFMSLPHPDGWISSICLTGALSIGAVLWSTASAITGNRTATLLAPLAGLAAQLNFHGSSPVLIASSAGSLG